MEDLTPGPGELEPIESASMDELHSLQIERLQWSPDIIMVTPSYMLNIIDEMERQGIDRGALRSRWVSSVRSRGPMTCGSRWKTASTCTP
ncbi:MAG: hypothetical protein ACXWXF_13160 [Aeromicrobium sp.]